MLMGPALTFSWLSSPDSDREANTLLADHLFSPALFLAERIERGLIPVSHRTGQSPFYTLISAEATMHESTVVELGAGCALPSLLMTATSEPPSLVVVTDYPDDVILGNLKRNVERNRQLVTGGCEVRCRGYEWGKGVEPLMCVSSLRLEHLLKN